MNDRPPTFWLVCFAIFREAWQVAVLVCALPVLMVLAMKHFFFPPIDFNRPIRGKRQPWELPDELIYAQAMKDFRK